MARKGFFPMLTVAGAVAAKNTVTVKQAAMKACRRHNEAHEFSFF